MARPKKNNRKTRGIRVRLTEEEFQLLDIVAEVFGTTKSKCLLEGFDFWLKHFAIDDLRVIIINEKYYQRISKN